jgi:hypothetical protein
LGHHMHQEEVGRPGRDARWSISDIFTVGIWPGTNSVYRTVLVSQATNSLMEAMFPLHCLGTQKNRKYSRESWEQDT